MAAQLMVNVQVFSLIPMTMFITVIESDIYEEFNTASYEARRAT